MQLCIQVITFIIGVARFLDWEGAQTTSHIGEEQKKEESSQFDLGFLIGGAPNLKLQSGDQT